MDLPTQRSRQGTVRHKPLVVNVVVVCPFEEEEEGISIASNVVKVEGGDRDTPSTLRGDRVRRDVGDLGSWVLHPWLARGNPGTITIPQYWLNKTKQHTAHVQKKSEVQVAL